MQKKIKLIFSVLAVLFFSITVMGRAEAAWVAVLPIEIDDTKVERAKDFNDYYWDIVVNRFQYPDYELMDDEKVSAGIPEKGLPSYERTVLADIADKIDADIIIAMRLDSVDEKRGSMFAEEPMVEYSMYGEFASYHRLTGKYFHNKIMHRDKTEEVLLLRSDWQYEFFNAELNRYINRTLEEDTKKKNIEKKEEKMREKKSKKDNKKVKKQEEKP